MMVIVITVTTIAITKSATVKCGRVISNHGDSNLNSGGLKTRDFFTVATLPGIQRPGS